MILQTAANHSGCGCVDGCLPAPEPPTPGVPALERGCPLQASSARSVAMTGDKACCLVFSSLSESLSEQDLERLHFPSEESWGLSPENSSLPTFRSLIFPRETGGPWVVLS